MIIAYITRRRFGGAFARHERETEFVQRAVSEARQKGNIVSVQFFERDNVIHKAVITLEKEESKWPNTTI